ncbi:hypothetical protein DXG01_005757 [Tephrocybe rancida]|nr:hypothetical protein DXG01_005757 [Tephrocybe rancida]
MAPVHLPLDLFEEVLNVLIQEDNKAIQPARKALVTCGLVSTVLAARVQQHLFSCIRLKTGEEWTALLPVSYIAFCVDLKQLRIKTPSRTPHIVAEELPGALTTERGAQQLERLDLDDPTCLKPFISNGPHPLKELRLVSEPALKIPWTSVVHLLRNAQEFLEVLIIEPFVPKLLDDLVEIDLVSVRVLILGAFIDRGDDSKVFLDGIVSVLEYGGMSVPRALQEVEIIFYPSDLESLTMINAWRRIDAALSHPRYRQFAELTLRFLDPTENTDFYNMKSRGSFFHRSGP